jgi:hypothetical protein
LKDNNVRIREEDDQLLWSLNPSGDYVPKVGYKALVEEGREEQHEWWWKILWKLKCPTKSKFFMWLILNNRILHGTYYKKGPLLVLDGAIYVTK